MAIVTAGISPLDMGHIGAFDESGQIVSSGFGFATFRNSNGTFDTYTFNGVVIPPNTVDLDRSTFTGIQHESASNQLIYSLTSFNLTFNQWNSYEIRNDPVGLLAFILRGNDTINGSTGIDVLRGFAGNDTYTVTTGDVILETATGGVDIAQSFDSYTLGSNVEYLTLLGGGNTSGTGNALANIIVGNSGNNILSGLAGDDRFMFLNNGSNTFNAGDTINGGTGNDIIDMQEGPVNLIDADFAHVTGVEVLSLHPHLQQQSAALGLLSQSAGITKVVSTQVIAMPDGISVDASARTLAITLIGGTAGDTLIGGAGNDAISGGGGNDFLIGNGGADSIAGGIGNDTYYVGIGDVLTEAISAGLDVVFSNDSFVLAANLENLTLTGTSNVNATGNASVNILTGNSGNNILSGGAGADTLIGGAGNDTYVLDNAADSIVEDSVAGTDTVQVAFGSSYSISSRPELENITLLGTVANAIGNAGINVLIGNASANTLNGGGGADQMAGGLGNDSYVVDDAGDLVVESANAGTDTVSSSISFTLAANVEALTLAGSADINATGNTLVNTLRGNDGANRLDGAGGIDSMIGGLGDDTYVVDNPLDTITETASAGNDSVESSTSHILSVNVEKLTLTGTAAINGAGNSLNNILIGNSGNNILNGGLGADQMTGGAGNDIYVIDNPGDTVIELAGALTGSDTVMIGRTVDLNTEFDNVENVTLNVVGAFDITGDAADNTLIGNTSANKLTGNGGNDILDGGLGADTLDGGLGNDTYILNGADIILADADGNDTVQTSGSFSIEALSDLENITLLGAASVNATGNNFVNILVGNAGANKLIGGGGDDTMTGGGGNDIYVVDSTADTVAEITPGAAGGIDLVQSSVDWTLGANVENLTLTGAGNVFGKGNELNNILLGNAGINRLDGKAGADTMTGGAGDDTYVVDNALDKITELAAGGLDTVESSLTLVLGANLENLTLTGTGNINATGNTLNNLLIGNSGKNILNGGLGADHMEGGAGDDTYFMDSLLDVIVEEPGAGNGIDTVQVSVGTSFDISGRQELENIVLLGTVGSATGNDGNNVLTGNAAANTLSGGAGNDLLNGGAGADTLVGGTGNDIYVVDNALDNVVEDSNAGTDTIQSTATYRIDIRPYVENITLIGAAAIGATGNEQANSLVGNAAANILTGLGGNDTLDGGGGADIMIGGDGDDTYTVNVSTDVIRENTNQGTDAVFSSATYVLSANIEVLTLTGSANLNGTGNELANLIAGNDGNNVINGGLGADTMIGGEGNDTYVVDNNNDIVSEDSNDGTDLVQSSAPNYVLADNVENLILTGTLAINATGNDLGNVMTGNAAANTLSGAAGSDTLNGAAGADTLIGGDGDDLYVVDNAGDQVTELSDEGQDLVQSTITYALSDNVENLLLLGAAAIGATGNSLDNTLTGNAAANVLNGSDGNDTLVGNAGNDLLNGGLGDDTLNGGIGADTMSGNAGDDQYFVDSTTDKVLENASEGDDTVRATVSIALLAVNVENLVLLGTTALNGTGNAENNFIFGNSANNALSGGDGNDSLDGGAGNDTLNGSNGSDSLDGGVGSDTLNGDGGNDSLVGGADNDTLNGGAGDDTLIGGLGNDVYVVDSAGDTVVESGNEGLDTIQTSISLVLADNVENLLLLGTAGINGTGNVLNNILTGNAGDNVLSGANGNDTLIGNAGNDSLDGGSGNDSLQGGLGNDVYFVDSAGDVVTEAAGAGTDTVNSTVSYALSLNVENLVLAGSADLNGTGNALNNSLTGNSGNNVLNGGAGNDTMTGGAGNDVYVVDSAGDAVVESGNGGLDTIQTLVSLALAGNVENLLLLGTAGINGTGNVLNNVLTGNSGNNILSGMDGNDIVSGGAGIDTLSGGSGDDSLDGGIGNDILDGGNGHDILDGGAGNDRMVGGAGDDWYDVDSASDTVIEALNEGIDLVNSLVSFSLGANVENLTLYGVAAINGTGNETDNVIYGNAANNVLTGNSGNDELRALEGNDTLHGGTGNDLLDGGEGGDSMDGGAGDDTYYVDDALDVVTELANGGTDTVVSTLDYTLGLNLENLVLSGNASTGTGNALGNSLVAGSGDDILDGKQGADSMTGGAGDDFYFVDDAGDSVVELLNEGHDTVKTSASSYIMQANVEDAVLIALGIGVTGNALANNIGIDANFAATATGVSINGGEGNDTLAGGAGNDVFDFSGAAGADDMTGGVGNDTYYVDNAGDTVHESVDGGNADSVIVAAGLTGTYTLADNVEIVSVGSGAGAGHELIGNALDNFLNGGAGNDTLRGGAGNDQFDGKAGGDLLYGGLGDDTYLVDAADTVIENSGEGYDTIKASISYVLPDNVEKLVKLDGVGDADASLTGNALDNWIIGGNGNDTITGGIGNDTLDGGAGVDTLIGGLGNDTFIMIGSEDSIVENSGEGSDTVQFQSIAANVSFTLPDNFENLTLLNGAGGESMIGNDLDNVLIGNDSDNHLSGGLGNDTLDGGLGINYLSGGSGNDTYVIHNSFNDHILEEDGQGNDTVRTAGNFQLSNAPAIENIAFTGSTNVMGVGNDFENVITAGDGWYQMFGEGGNDTLLGGLNPDSLHGGDGNDFLDGGGGSDLMFGDAGDDTFVFNPSVAGIDGGTGTDTIKISGSGQTADFSGSGNPFDHIDFLDLTGTGDNTLIISMSRAANMVDANTVLKITGDAGDKVTLTGPGWSNAVHSTIDGYEVYHYGSPVIMIQTGIDISIV